jgi:hypothetical protein
MSFRKAENTQREEERRQRRTAEKRRGKRVEETMGDLKRGEKRT